MGLPYASPEFEMDVREHILKNYPRCRVVVSGTVAREMSEIATANAKKADPNAKEKVIDHNQVKAALEQISPNAGKGRLLGAGGCDLIREADRLGKPSDRWWYDPPTDHSLPLFPLVHSVASKWAPRLHDLSHGQLTPLSESR